jgi:hypothetical protein
LKHLESGCAVACFNDGVTLLDKYAGQELPDDAVIFDQQNAVRPAFSVRHSTAHEVVHSQQADWHRIPVN